MSSWNYPMWGPVPGVKSLSFPSIYQGTRGGCESKEFSPPWKAVRPFAKAVDGNTSLEFEKEFEHDLPASAGAIVPNGRVLGMEGVVFDNQGYLLAEPARKIGRAPQDWPELYRFIRERPTRLIGTWGVLTGAGSSGYFHWMLDVLPKIQIIRSMNLTINGWIVPNSGAAFIKESLQLAGIEAPVICIHPRQQIIADQLVVASVPSESGNPPPWVRNFYDAIPVTASNTPCNLEKIYISRSRARCRKVCNESELTKELLRVGFEIVYLEDLSVKEQAMLFRRASAVLAPHGAGLSNLVFAPATTKVLEIFPERYVNVCYWAIACLINMPYSYLISQSIRHSTDPSLDNMRLSSENIRSIVQWAETAI